MSQRFEPPTPSVPSPAGAPPNPHGAMITALVVLAAALSAAVVYLPRMMLSGPSDLVTGTRDAVVEYWASGGGDHPPYLSELVDQWRNFHAVKAGLAGLLLAVSVTLAIVVWRRLLQRRSGIGVLIVSGSGITALAVLSLVLVMANLQGLAAPFSSLMSMLPIGRDQLFAPTATDIRRHLSDGLSTPPLRDMIDDFAAYHAVLAVIAGVVAAVLLLLALTTWRAARLSMTRRITLAAGMFGGLFTVLVVASVVLCVANSLTAAHPEPALLDFFGG